MNTETGENTLNVTQEISPSKFSEMEPVLNPTKETIVGGAELLDSEATQPINGKIPHVPIPSVWDDPGNLRLMSRVEELCLLMSIFSSKFWFRCFQFLHLRQKQ